MMVLVLCIKAQIIFPIRHLVNEVRKSRIFPSKTISTIHCGSKLLACVESKTTSFEFLALGKPSDLISRRLNQYILVDTNIDFSSYSSKLGFALFFQSVLSL